MADIHDPFPLAARARIAKLQRERQESADEAFENLKLLRSEEAGPGRGLELSEAILDSVFTMWEKAAEASTTQFILESYLKEKKG